MSYWDGKSVLVSGGNGFIGSHIVRRLRSLGSEVIIVDIKTGDRKSPSDKEDIRSLEELQITIKTHKVGIVFHLAAQAIVNVANQSPISTFDTNVKGTWLLLEACRLSPSIESVVVASSDKCYGEPKFVPITEDHPLLALNPYDSSKTMEDILARGYAKTYDLPISVTRCSNVYGPGDKHLSRIIPGTITSVFKNEAPIIRSDGTPLRDYLFIDDCVEAYLKLAENTSRFRGEAFNFGTGHPSSVLNLTKSIIRLCGSNVQPKILNVERNFIKRQYLDSRKAFTLLGWQAKISLEEGLKRTVNAYRMDMLKVPSEHPGKRRPIWPY